MNEFIVWGNKKNKFINKEDALFIECGSYSCILVDALKYPNERYDILNCIGKKDINGKKIYADCSIVEFEYVKTNNKSTKLWGYFIFNDDRLCYQIAICGDEKYDFSSIPIRNIKIIDTIQKNKLGLIKDK